MAASSSSSRTRSSGPVLRSISPSGRLHTFQRNSSCFSSSSSSSAFASSTSSSFSSPSTTFFNHDNNGYHHHHHHHHRSASPTRVNIYTSTPLTRSFRFSIDRSTSPTNTSITVYKQNDKKTCMCSPTSHPGSFRCSLHKNNSNHGTASFPSNRLNMRRSAMTNSLVRIGSVEGEWVKRALTALIRPSSHQQKRRAAFQSRPSRLSFMTKAEGLP
ncbi:hypothetical protein CFOL_v3_04088 [Cephalotus follicularis]|uniref:Serine-rich protein-like protein n=1 Tax=Cephalotus follicularis TaxID=3775 RepID=A0A1Q3AXX6_CEPFO|nr:hypothetical protein CFOL_v3_04088 [Cephalotus follicularis]